MAISGYGNYTPSNRVPTPTAGNVSGTPTVNTTPSVTNQPATTAGASTTPSVTNNVPTIKTQVYTANAPKTGNATTPVAVGTPNATASAPSSTANVPTATSNASTVGTVSTTSVLNNRTGVANASGTGVANASGTGIATTAGAPTGTLSPAVLVAKALDEAMQIRDRILSKSEQYKDYVLESLEKAYKTEEVFMRGLYRGESKAAKDFVNYTPNLSFVRQEDFDGFKVRMGASISKENLMVHCSHNSEITFSNVEINILPIPSVGEIMFALHPEVFNVDTRFSSGLDFGPYDHKLPTSLPPYTPT